MKTNAEWSYPGGLLDQGESIKIGAEREVLEETGVRGEFQGILALREYTNYKWGASDIDIVCILKPVGDETIDIHDI